MPLPFLPSIASGGGAIPISGGPSSSGPITTDVNAAPIRIGGLFESGTSSGGGFPVALVVGIVAVAAVVLLRKR